MDDAGNSDDDDDENGDGAAQSGKGSRRGRSAPRSSADGDRLGSANGRVERDRGVFVKFERDHYANILDSATLAGEPVHLQLDVTASGGKGSGWRARVVGDDITQTSKRPAGRRPRAAFNTEGLSASPSRSRPIHAMRGASLELSANWRGRPPAGKRRVGRAGSCAPGRDHPEANFLKRRPKFGRLAHEDDQPTPPTSQELAAA